MLKLFFLILLFILVWMAVRRILRVLIFLGQGGDRGPDSRFGARPEQPFGAGGPFQGAPGGARRRGEKDITDRVRIVEERAGENGSVRR